MDEASAVETYNRACQLYEQGKPREAVELIDALIDAYPKQQTFQIARAKCIAAIKHTESLERGAAEVYDKACQLYEQGQLSAAIELLDSIISSFPKDQTFRIARERCRLKLEREADKEKSRKRLQELNERKRLRPEREAEAEKVRLELEWWAAEVYGKACQFYEHGNIGAAIKLFDSIITAFPRDQTFYISRKEYRLKLERGAEKERDVLEWEEEKESLKLHWEAEMEKLMKVKKIKREQEAAESKRLELEREAEKEKEKRRKRLQELTEKKRLRPEREAEAERVRLEQEAAERERLILETIRKRIPPPASCLTCGEHVFEFMSVSPNMKSAEWQCSYCTKVIRVKASDILDKKNSSLRRPIPKAVQAEVWRRDQRCCVNCGSQEKLEFDHIIPLAKGGGNTARNIQLLCETCNRSKSAKNPGEF